MVLKGERCPTFLPALLLSACSHFTFRTSSTPQLCFDKVLMLQAQWLKFSKMKFGPQFGDGAHRKHLERRGKNLQLLPIRGYKWTNLLCDRLTLEACRYPLVSSNVLGFYTGSKVGTISTKSCLSALTGQFNVQGESQLIMEHSETFSGTVNALYSGDRRRGEDEWFWFYLVRLHSCNTPSQWPCTHISSWAIKEIYSVHISSCMIVHKDFRASFVHIKNSVRHRTYAE